jgi:lycopene cyclase domain-containing protein
METLYAWVNIAAISVPLLFSFHKKGNFYKRLKHALIAIGIMALFFISWDVLFTIKGVWGFNGEYLLGPALLHLPIEEWMFFICIPYAFMFSYDQIVILKTPDFLKKYIKKIDLFFLIIASLYLVVGFGNIYTTTISSMVIAFMLIIFRLNPPNRGLFYLSYAIILIPFTIVNGILTGSITPDPIVWYNDAENLGVRFLTIPIEDFLYYFLMYGMSYLIYEKLKKAPTNG